MFNNRRSRLLKYDSKITTMGGIYRVVPKYYSIFAHVYSDEQTRNPAHLKFADFRIGSRILLSRYL